MAALDGMARLRTPITLILDTHRHHHTITYPILDITIDGSMRSTMSMKNMWGAGGRDIVMTAIDA